MAEHQVQIALPITSVHRAWQRYAGHGNSEAGDDTVAWSADDDGGFTATLTSYGPESTTLAARLAEGSDADPGAAHLAEFVDGFVAYVESAHRELDVAPGLTAGSAPSGPDGTAHIAGDTPEIP